MIVSMAFERYFASRNSLSTHQVCKDWELEKDTKVNSECLLIKSSKKTFYSFTCNLPHFMVHETTKEFFLKSYFESMTDGFFLRYLNSLWQTSPEMGHQKDILTDIML